MGDCSNCAFRTEPGSDGVAAAPKYIRVQSTWIERFQLIVLVSQIMLLLYFLVFGSLVARQGAEDAEGTRLLLCQRVYDNSPEQWDRYSVYCPELAAHPR